MAKKPEKLSAAQQKAVRWIHSGSAKSLGAIGVEVGKMLAEITVELADAKQQAEHWKAAFEVVRDEMKVAIATVLAKGGEVGKAADSGRPHLIVRKQDFALAIGLELYTMPPDAHTRVYELRERQPGKSPIDDAVRRIVSPH